MAGIQPVNLVTGIFATGYGSTSIRLAGANLHPHGASRAHDAPLPFRGSEGAQPPARLRRGRTECGPKEYAGLGTLRVPDRPAASALDGFRGREPWVGEVSIPIHGEARVRWCQPHESRRFPRASSVVPEADRPPPMAPPSPPDSARQSPSDDGEAMSRSGPRPYRRRLFGFLTPMPRGARIFS